MERLLLPRDNAAEAAVIQDIAVYPIDTLPQVVEWLTGQLLLAPLQVDLQATFAVIHASLTSRREARRSSNARWR